MFSQNLNSVLRYLPDSLKCIFVGETIDCAIACIGHVVIHYARTRAGINALIQLGLGVQLDHRFRSRLFTFIKKNMQTVSVHLVQKICILR